MCYTPSNTPTPRGNWLLPFVNSLASILLGALFALLLATTSCKKDCTPIAAIEGHWVKSPTTNPEWHYYFADNRLTLQVVTFGIVTDELISPYTMRRDTLFVGDGIQYPVVLHKVQFTCDSFAKLDNITPGAMLRYPLTLRKLPP